MADRLPLPPSVSDATYSDLASARPLMRLDDDGREVIRQMLAQAYSIGYTDGRRVTLQSKSIDAYVATEMQREASQDGDTT